MNGWRGLQVAEPDCAQHLSCVGKHRDTKQTTAAYGKLLLAVGPLPDLPSHRGMLYSLALSVRELEVLEQQAIAPIAQMRRPVAG